MQETLLILDFGSQYTQLIARRIRELNVYCEIHPFNAVSKLKHTLFSESNRSGCLKGIILSGSPFSVKDKNAPTIRLNDFPHTVPVLGVCYGAQLMVNLCGGEIVASKIREYGRAHLVFIDKKNPLMKKIPHESQVWMSHGDTVKKLPPQFRVIAGTKDVNIAAYCTNNKSYFGVQFHPEVFHSTDGTQLLKNFVIDICGCSQSWTPESFIEDTVRALKLKLGKDKVVLGLSGGVDSTVAAMLLQKAIEKNLYCIFIDNGLLRKSEFNEVLHVYRDMGLHIKGVDAKNIFYKNLKDITEPEAKRKIIGKTFIDEFDNEAHRIKNVKWLAQGTIYPDVIESVSVRGPSATIKSHHNVGGLPQRMKMKVVEPLNTLFKDEVRKVGMSLGIKPEILHRHPFPGPGLAVRIIGGITPEKISLLQEVDYIFINALRKYNLYQTVWQAFAVLLPVKSVGVMGDERTYQNVVALRAVTSTDGMTADWCHLPYEFLGKVSNEIINKVKGVNRVVYDISSKPPATIEWE